MFKNTKRANTLFGISLLLILNSPAAVLASNEASKSDLKDALTQVNDLGESTHRLLHSIVEVRGECNHHGINPEDELSQAVMNPDMYYSGMFPAGSDTIGSGPLLPARQKWIDYDMKQLSSVMDNLKSEIDALNASTNSVLKSDGPVKAQLAVLSDSFQVALAKYSDMRTLTAAPPYDNAKITLACKTMTDQIAGIEECRKSVLRALKHAK